MSPPSSCYHCSKAFELSANAQLGFRDTCAYCGKDAHICKNCKFFDEGSHRECREISAEWVREKEKANRCEYFKISNQNKDLSEKKIKALESLDALFKNSS